LSRILPERSEGRTPKLTCPKTKSR